MYKFTVIGLSLHHRNRVSGEVNAPTWKEAVKKFSQTQEGDFQFAAAFHGSVVIDGDVQNLPNTNGFIDAGKKEPFTIVGFQHILDECCVDTDITTHWVKAAYAAIVHYFDGSENRSSSYDFICVLKGHHAAAGTWEEMVEGHKLELNPQGPINPNIEDPSQTDENEDDVPLRSTQVAV